MADSLTLLEQHPLVERVETASFDYGSRFGVAVRSNGRRYAIKAESQDKAIAAMLNWLNEGKA